MCGRYTIRQDWRRLHDLYRLTTDADVAPAGLAPSFNAAPGQALPIVGERGARRSLILSRWGMIPPWATGPSDGRLTTINARAETLETSKLYGPCWHGRRCLVPADGWYEWRQIGKGKQPHFIARADGAPFAFAGLWSLWRGADGAPVVSHTIVTTVATPALAGLHERMPVVLDPGDYDDWLHAAVPPRPLLRAHDGPWREWPVSPRVGKVAENDAGLVEETAAAVLF
ncbi:SOS response-associated peptidase [Zavarzinia compransoris]|uniref:Abasic site processing protein n=1 Tax=Zavarzinia compransoris TaxID=1264899 RepID=A0A317E6J1_9PROT|nr:SOS response-associated peptidase [Zavarzinia compransoris]PWR21846.1 DUF159 family protein [Zavarzinia compransoris]TDP45350.1 putative SOS response-associated peptidase YedK [Zavarzinia compransoris]